MIASDLLPMILVWIGSLLVFAYFRLPDKCQTEKLRRRLWGYAQLKLEPKKKSVSPPRYDQPLENGEFEVLLGILKKIEAKNATLMTVWGFLLSAFVAAFFQSKELKTQIFVLFVCSVPFFIFAIMGTKQVDNSDLNQIQKDQDFKDVYHELADDLIQDALNKENLFFLSRTGAYILVLVLPVLFWLDIK